MSGMRHPSLHISKKFLAQIAGPQCTEKGLYISREEEEGVLNADYLHHLLIAIKKNRSILKLHLTGIWDNEEFSGVISRTRIMEDLAQVIIRNPIIYNLNLSRNRLSESEVSTLVSALNDRRVQQDPSITILMLSNGNYDGAAGILRLIKTQLNNRKIQQIDVRGSIPFNELCTASGRITATAIGFANLFRDHPNIVAKLMLDPAVKNLIVGLVDEYKLIHRPLLPNERQQLNRFLEPDPEEKEEKRRAYQPRIFALAPQQNNTIAVKSSPPSLKI